VIQWDLRRDSGGQRDGGKEGKGAERAAALGGRRGIKSFTFLVCSDLTVKIAAFLSLHRSPV
jgi:hypothetical protein